MRIRASKEIPGRQVAGMTVRITSEGKKGSSLKQWVPQAEPRLGAGGDQDHSSAGSLAPAGGNHGPCMCFAARVSTDGVPGAAEGSMGETRPGNPTHNTPPICGNLADLDASVKVLVHVTCHECQSYVHNFNNATPRTGLVAAFADPDWALALGW